MPAEKTLLKTAYHFLLLLVGFDTLTYQKDYNRSPTLVGHQGHPRGHSQAHARQASTAAPMQLPAHQLGTHLRVDVRLPSQLSACLCGGMQIFMKALRPRHLSSLSAYMALTASLAWARVEAGRGSSGRDGPRSLPQ